MNRWLEIDLSAIVHNIQVIKKEISWPKVKLMPVIKANAYGHGLVEIGKICQKEKVDFIAVATFDEAMSLRNNGINLSILIIGYTDKDEIEPAILNNITLSIYDINQANDVIKIAKNLNKVANIHLKLDTGMHRLGFLPEDFLEVYRKLIKDKNLKIEYIYSHFAEVGNDSFRTKQLKVLKNILNEIKKSQLSVPKVHIARSESITMKDTHFSMIRPGLALYGLAKISNLKAALTFKTKIAQVKKIKKGDYVGYGLTFRAPKDMQIATIAVGYADGYSRNLSNIGEVLVNGRKCRIIGRICMNLTIIDVSQVKEIKIGNVVTLIGKDGTQEITVESLAKKIKTIPYEVVARISSDVPRIYKR